MNVILKIVIIIIVILAIVIIWLANRLEVPRYMRMKRASIRELDKNYRFKKFVSTTRIVVSMSTIPDRLKYMKPTLCSILDQNVRVHEICINIPKISRKGLKYSIPKWLSELKSITIHRVEKDEGPATKLLPTLRRESTSKSKHHLESTKIIVIDDDNIYHSNTIQTLVACSMANPKCAITNYGVKLNKAGLLPDIKTRIRMFYQPSMEVDLLQGFSGFLVTPDMFPERVYEIKDCPPEAISVDDVWFSGWLRYNKTKIITPDYTYRQMPIVNFGKMRTTPALAHGENKAFVTDLKVIKWFIDEHRVLPVCLT